MPVFHHFDNEPRSDPSSSVHPEVMRLYNLRAKKQILSPVVKVDNWKEKKDLSCDIQHYITSNLLDTDLISKLAHKMDAMGCGIFLWQSEIDKYICRNGCDESTCLAKIVNLRFPETQAKCHFNNSDIHDIIESKLKIVDSGSLRGPAVVTTKPVRKGAIVAEYCGIYREVSDYWNRWQLLGFDKKAWTTGVFVTYMLPVNSYLVIDSHDAGNKTTHIRHEKCDPSCIAECYIVDGFPRIFLRARRTLFSGNELTLDYTKNSIERSRAFDYPCKCNSCVVEKFTVSKCACFYGNTPCSELHMYANNTQAKKPMQSSSKANLKTRKKYTGFRDSEENFALSKKRGRGRPRKASENHSNSILKKKSRVNKAQVAAAIRNVIGLPRIINSTATELNKIIDEVSKLPEEDPDIAIISCISGQLDNNDNMEIVPATRVSENLICCICEKVCSNIDDRVDHEQTHLDMLQEENTYGFTFIIKFSNNQIVQKTSCYCRYSPCGDCILENLSDGISNTIEDGSVVSLNDHHQFSNITEYIKSLLLLCLLLNEFVKS